MIIKDLIELCPVEEIVSEIMLMCGVDESEREGISRNHTAFINNLKKKNTNRHRIRGFRHYLYG